MAYEIMFILKNTHHNICTPEPFEDSEVSWAYVIFVGRYSTLSFELALSTLTEKERSYSTLTLLLLFTMTRAMGHS